MIAIFSIEGLEDTTNDIIDWIDHFNGDFVRINGEAFLKEVKIENGEIRYRDINFNNINVCYFRRFYSEPTFNILEENKELLNKSFLHFIDSLRNEYTTILEYLWFHLKDKIWFSHPINEIRINKILTLELAKKASLNIPEYIITGNKEDVIAFHKKHNDIITKAISDIPIVTLKDRRYNFLTKRVDHKILETLDNSFYISLFQKQIFKEYEIRSFFFYDTIYSIIILSQKNIKTSIDSRDYDYKNPNIEIPYKLPIHIEEKLMNLFKVLNLTTCSVDLIKEKDTDKYYFLEINSIGQFGNVSHSGNYFLEKIIAQKLIEIDEKEKTKKFSTN